MVAPYVILMVPWEIGFSHSLWPTILKERAIGEKINCFNYFSCEHFFPGAWNLGWRGRKDPEKKSPMWRRQFCSMFSNGGILSLWVESLWQNARPEDSAKFLHQSLWWRLYDRLHQRWNSPGYERNSNKQKKCSSRPAKRVRTRPASTWGACISRKDARKDLCSIIWKPVIWATGQAVQNTRGCPAKQHAKQD